MPPPDHKRKLNSRATEQKGSTDAKGKRPPHERPAIFPKGLKRPDLNAMVDGHAIASEFQQKFYEYILNGNCVRCHSKDHSRSACKDAAGKWETKFDQEKEKYWTGTLKWQQKALTEPAPTKSKPPPTLIQKKTSRYQALPYQDSDDDTQPPLQHRATWGIKNPPPESDDDAELSPEELREAIIESTDMLMIDYSDDDALDILYADPFFEILRQTRHTSLVLFSGGIHGVFFTSEVDQARAHHALPPAAPETATLMTDDGSRPLSPSELATLTTEVDSLVASLQLPEPTTPLIPRAPWTREGDPRSEADADAA